MKPLFFFCALPFFISIINASAQTSFLKYYSGSGTEDVSFSAITKKGTSYFAVGNEGNKILIVEFDASGQVVSNATLTVIGETKTPVCRSASFNAFNDLQICGYRGLIGTPSTYEAFILAYDYENENISWLRTVTATGDKGSAFSKTRQSYVCGYTSEPEKNEEGAWWFVNGETGFMTQYDKLNIGSGREEFTSFATIPSNNRQMLVGTFDYSETGDSILRPIACRYGPPTLLSQKGYLKDTASVARLYANDVTTMLNAPLITICSGDGSGTAANKDLYYFKFFPGDQYIRAARKIEFTNTEFDGKLMAVRQREANDEDDQKIIYGNKNDPTSENQLGDVFLISFYNQDQLSWAKSYPFTCPADGRGVDALLLDGNDVFAVGRAFDNASGYWKGALLKVDALTGSLPGCETDEPVDIIEEPKIQLSLIVDKEHRTDNIGSGKTTIGETAISSSDECSGFVISEVHKSTEQVLGDEDNNQLFIFPNPASNIIHLRLPPTPSTITLFNLLGEKVKEEKVSGGLVSMDVSELPDGMYVVRLNVEVAGKPSFVRTTVADL